MRCCPAAVQAWKSVAVTFKKEEEKGVLLSSAEILQYAAFENFHLLLGILQLGLAQLQEFRAALVGGQ